MKLLSCVLELFFVVTWFGVLHNAEANPPLQWANDVPVVVFVVLYVASVVLRTVGEGKRSPNLQWAGTALFMFSLFARPVAGWLTSW